MVTGLPPRQQELRGPERRSSAAVIESNDREPDEEEGSRLFHSLRRRSARVRLQLTASSITNESKVDCGKILLSVSKLQSTCPFDVLTEVLGKATEYRGSQRCFRSLWTSSRCTYQRQGLSSERRYGQLGWNGKLWRSGIRCNPSQTTRKYGSLKRRKGPWIGMSVDMTL